MNTLKTLPTVEEMLTRGVEQVLPSKAGLAALMAKKKITLYLGIDPTGSQLHLGHSVVLRKLQQFAALGHRVILLIGNGTVKIGDPTGRDKTRPVLTDEQIEEHFATWKAQAAKVLNFDMIEIRRNGDWLDKLTFPEMVKIMATTTAQQLLERDMFQERIKKGLPIFAHELMYPLLQGYDSVVMDVDLEIGGNDQTFNMMVGRHMQEVMAQRDKFVLACKLLVGSDGNKMGKSLGNFIAMTETPENMYGKLMAIVDSAIIQYFTLLTDVPMAEIARMEKELASGAVNPMELKKQLARAVTAMYHSEETAQQAQEHFEKTVQRHETPEEVVILKVVANEPLLELVMRSNVLTSKGEARRLIEQGGVQIDGEKKVDCAAVIAQKAGMVVKVGKRSFFRLE